jgi:hypothetical protein
MRERASCRGCRRLLSEAPRRGSGRSSGETQQLLNVGDGLADRVEVERVDVLPGHIATGFLDQLAPPTILTHMMGTRDDLTVSDARWRTTAHARWPRWPRSHVLDDEPGNPAGTGAGAKRNAIIILANALCGRSASCIACNVQFHPHSLPHWDGASTDFLRSIACAGIPGDAEWYSTEVRQMINPRESLQKVIDELQFRMDVFPKLYYQPLPWVGLNKARRAEGTKARWHAIESVVRDQAFSSAMDIGCDVGYFCFSLASAGVPTLGVDIDDRDLRIAFYVKRKVAISNVAFLRLRVDTDTVVLLPNADLVLLLSVWHHWVREHGLEHASRILNSVWTKCGKVMIFETGESEMSDKFALPRMEPSPEVWLRNYLSDICSGSQVVQLGKFKAFDEQQKVAYRSLFKVSRMADDVVEGPTGPAGF